MKDDEGTAENKGSRSLWGFILWPFLIVLLYVLSSGPATTISEKNIVSHNVWIIYRPLGWAYFSTPLGRPLGMYWHLWSPGNFTADGHLAKP